MKILVDTSVWSLALRRKEVVDTKEVVLLKKFIEDGEQIFLIGLILQEILSGISAAKLFKRLADYLGAFPLVELSRQDYIKAADLRNGCVKKGIQAGAIDFLIASVCISHDLSLFSSDKDFQSIAGMSDLKLVLLGSNSQA